MNMHGLLQQLPFYERRQRIKRPLTLVVFGIFFLLLPIYNYFGLAYKYQIHPKLFLRAFVVFNAIELFLLFLPIAIGIGLLMVSKWGWWLFLTFATSLVIYNTYSLAIDPVMVNMSALLQTMILMGGIFYFLRKDIAAPYMKMYPRGWRFQKRYPLEIKVTLNGIELLTRDFSSKGIYVSWPEVNCDLGSEVDLIFTLDNKKFLCKGGIAVVNEGHGAGIAFRNIDSQQARELRKSVLLEERKRRQKN
ncbi:MAG: PilZ domain-containing protein [Spirochaetota bacterium]